MKNSEPGMRAYVLVKLLLIQLFLIICAFKLILINHLMLAAFVGVVSLVVGALIHFALWRK